MGRPADNFLPPRHRARLQPQWRCQPAVSRTRPTAATSTTTAAAAAGRECPAASKTPPRPCASAARKTARSRIYRRLRCRRAASPTRAARDTGAGTISTRQQGDRCATSGRWRRGPRALASPSEPGEVSVRSAPATERARERARRPISRRRRGRRSSYRAALSASLAPRRSPTRLASGRPTLPRRSRHRANRPRGTKSRAAARAMVTMASALRIAMRGA